MPHAPHLCQDPTKITRYLQHARRGSHSSAIYALAGSRVVTRLVVLATTLSTDDTATWFRWKTPIPLMLAPNVNRWQAFSKVNLRIGLV
jgi:hypothetical protein